MAPTRETVARLVFDPRLENPTRERGRTSLDAQHECDPYQRLWQGWQQGGGRFSVGSLAALGPC